MPPDHPVTSTRPPRATMSFTALKSSGEEGSGCGEDHYRLLVGTRRQVAQRLLPPFDVITVGLEQFVGGAGAMLACSIGAGHRVVVAVFTARKKSRDHSQYDNRADAADEQLAVFGVE